MSSSATVDVVRRCAELGGDDYEKVDSLMMITTTTTTMIDDAARCNGGMAHPISISLVPLGRTLSYVCIKVGYKIWSK